jgi:hypothetical protein
VQNAVVAGAHRQQTRYPIARSRPFRVVHKGESASPAGTMPVQPKNFNHRDQRAVCFASRAARRPCPPSTTPVPLLKLRARHERASAKCRMSGGLPSAARRRALRSGCDSLNAPLHSPLHFPRSPTADRSQSPNSMWGQNWLVFVTKTRQCL